MFQLLALYVGSLILRSIGIALFAGVCSWKIRNVAIRHAVWVAVLGAMLLLPAVDYLLPPRWVPARIQQIAAEQPTAFRVVPAKATKASPTLLPQKNLPAQSKTVNWWQAAVMLYVMVSGAMFVRLILAYRMLLKLRRACKAISSSVWEEIRASNRVWWRIPVLMESKFAHVLMTIGFLNPRVILPIDWRSWDEWKLRAVLIHEIAHVRRCDWAIAAISALAKCAYWLNPLLWFLERKLSQLAEHACDDATLSDTPNPTRYAEILLEFAVAAQNGGRLIKGGVAMSQPNMKARIERALDNPKTGIGIVKIAGWVLVTLAAAPVIYSAAALQVTPEPSKSAVAAYASEFGKNPLPQTPAASLRAAPSPVPATAPQAGQNVTNPAADQPDQFQMELENRRIQGEYEALKQKLAEAQLAASLDNSDPSPDPQRAAKISGSVSFLQDATRKALLNVIQMLQTEVAVREKNIAQVRQQIGNQLNPNQSQLDQLHANEEALERYKAELSRFDKQIEEKQLTSSSSQVVDSNSKYRVYVTGKVQKPGDIPWDKPLTVLQALALAGGFQEYAKSDVISIIRMNGNSSTLLRFNYSEVIRGVNNSQNIYLENGDVVVVP